MLVEDTGASPYDPQAPVLMRNAGVSRHFESLVRFLELPRAGSVDPTLLMTMLLPLMFGAMVGDVGYGAILLVVAIFVRRRLAPHAVGAPEVAGLIWVLLLGAAWSIFFGVLYGEVLGDLGTRVLGDWAVWKERPSAGALEPLLLLAVAIGAAHVALGLGLGAWQAIRFRGNPGCCSTNWGPSSSWPNSKIQVGDRQARVPVDRSGSGCPVVLGPGLVGAPVRRLTRV